MTERDLILTGWTFWHVAVADLRAFVSVTDGRLLWIWAHWQWEDGEYASLFPDLNHGNP